MIIHGIQVTGSFDISGSFQATASYAVTASYALNGGGAISVTEYPTYQDLINNSGSAIGSIATVANVNNTFYINLNEWFAVEKFRTYTSSFSTMGYYPLDGNTSDYSGLGRDASSEINITYASGAIGQAAEFNLSSSITLISASVDTGSGSPATFIMWVKLASTSSNMTLIEFLDPVTDVSRTIGYVSTGKYQFRRLRQNIVDNSFTYDFVDMGWHHIAWVYDSVKVYGYIDGIPVGSVASSGDGSGLTLWRYGIGSSNAQTSFFTGSIDNVIIENRAWSSSEIFNHYRQTS